MSGGGGGSSSSSTTTTQTDGRIAASDEAVVIQVGEGASITVDDPEAWDRAVSVVEQYETLMAASFGFAQAESDKANALVGRILDQQDSDDYRAWEGLTKWGTVIAVAAVGAWAWSKR